MRSNIIFCDICCFSSATSCATSLPSSLGALQIQDRSPQSRPVASRNQSQTHSDATDLNCGDQSQFSGICNAPLGLALHCYKVYAKINTKIGNSIPCKIVTPENFSSKVCTRDYVGTTTIYCADFSELKIGSVGASPQVGEAQRLVSCPVLFSRAPGQVEPVDRFSRFMTQTTSFRTRRCLLGFTTIDDVIWRNMPLKLPKSGHGWAIFSKNAKIWKLLYLRNGKSDQAEPHADDSD